MCVQFTGQFYGKIRTRLDTPVPEHLLVGRAILPWGRKRVKHSLENSIVKFTNTILILCEFHTQMLQVSFMKLLNLTSYVVLKDGNKKETTAGVRDEFNREEDLLLLSLSQVSLVAAILGLYFKIYCLLVLPELVIEIELALCFKIYFLLVYPEVVMKMELGLYFKNYCQLLFLEAVIKMDLNSQKWPKMIKHA